MLHKLNEVLVELLTSIVWINKIDLVDNLYLAWLRR
jgi:hypothetical protein